MYQSLAFLVDSKAQLQNFLDISRAAAPSQLVLHLCLRGVVHGQ